MGWGLGLTHPQRVPPSVFLAHSPALHPWPSHTLLSCPWGTTPRSQGQGRDLRGRSQTSVMGHPAPSTRRPWTPARGGGRGQSSTRGSGQPTASRLMTLGQMLTVLD